MSGFPIRIFLFSFSMPRQSPLKLRLGPHRRSRAEAFGEGGQGQNIPPAENAAPILISPQF